MTEQLSPTTQAVMIAATNGNAKVVSDLAYRQCIAAALRALDSRLGHDVLGVRCVDCSQIQLIAAELEGSND